MKELIKKQENRIQADLDNGKFGMICSNESTFKKYVFEFFKKVRKETVEEVFNKMEERNSVFKITTEFETSLEEEKQEGYNERKLEEKEIKKEILNNL